MGFREYIKDVKGISIHDDDDDKEDDDEVEDNNKDENNFKDISAVGLYRDLGFSRGHQRHQGNHPPDNDEEDDNEVEDNDKDDDNNKDNNNDKCISALG